MEIAIIGFGGMGRHVLEALDGHPRINRIHLVDPSSKQKPEGIGSRSDLVWHDSHHALLSETHSDFKLAFVTASNDAHKPVALDLIRAGKAVVLEKPIATTLEDSIQVVKASIRHRTFLQIGFEARYSKLYTGVKDWIDDGLLGDVINTHCTYICSEFHKKNSWRNRISTGGSMFGEKLCHYVDLPRWWIGSEVSEVYTLAAPNVVPYYEVHDNYHCSYKFENGAVSHLTFVMYLAQTFDGDPLENYVTQQMDDGHELRYLVMGTRGAAETDVFGRRLRRWEYGDTPECMTSKLVESASWGDKDDHRYFHDTTTQALDVVNRVLRGDDPFTDPEDSLRTMIVVDAAERSIVEGGPVRPVYPKLSTASERELPSGMRASLRANAAFPRAG